MPKPLIYLAAPYSHRDPDIRYSRFDAACKAAATIIRGDKHLVFSPISHSHPIALIGGLNTTYDCWREYNITMLSKCDQFWVLSLDGWMTSQGVLDELSFARKICTPCYLRDPQNPFLDLPWPPHLLTY